MTRALVTLLIGLGLLTAGVVAGGGWLHDRYVASPVSSKSLPARPALVRTGASSLDAILEKAHWVSPGLDGPALYKIGFRQCPDCVAFTKTTFADLHAAGVDTRVIMYAPRSGRYEADRAEQAVLAEMYLTQSWEMYDAWHASSPQAFYANIDLPPDVSTAPERAAVIAANREAHDAVAAVFARNGWDMERPAFLWKDPDGRWRTFMGDTERGRAMVLNALTKGR